MSRNLDLTEVGNILGEEMLNNFIKYAKDEYGCEITVEESDHPDTFEGIFYSSWEDKFVRILETDEWVVDYDKDKRKYRVSYFEDFHFVDEIWFDAYEDKEVSKKWYFLKDRLPKLNELVEVKIIVDGEERCYLDQLMQTKDGKYRWLYNYYGNAEISWRRV